MKNREEINGQNKETQPASDNKPNQRSTRNYSMRKSILNNPTLAYNPENVSYTNYFERIPYTKTKMMYQQKEIIQQIPVEKKITDYKEIKKKRLVPKERIVRDHYVVESKISYVPRLIPETKIEYVPVAVQTSRLEYVPVQKQIIYSGDILNGMDVSAINQSMNSTTLRNYMSSDNNNLNSKRSYSTDLGRRNYVDKRKEEMDYYSKQDRIRQTKNYESSNQNQRRNVFDKNTVYKLVEQRDGSQNLKRSRNYKIFDLPLKNQSMSRASSRIRYE